MIDIPIELIPDSKYADNLKIVSTTPPILYINEVSDHSEEQIIYFRKYERSFVEHYGVGKTYMLVDFTKGGTIAPIKYRKYIFEDARYNVENCNLFGFIIPKGSKSHFAIITMLQMMLDSKKVKSFHSLEEAIAFIKEKEDQ